QVGVGFHADAGDEDATLGPGRIDGPVEQPGPADAVDHHVEVVTELVHGGIDHRGGAEVPAHPAAGGGRVGHDDATRSHLPRPPGGGEADGAGAHDQDV